MGQASERELKGILMADSEVLSRVTKNLPQEESIPYMRIIQRPFVVVRAAGSFGVDMAVVGALSFLVEEKTSVEDVYRFNQSRTKDQAILLKQLCSSSGITPVLAYRLKNLRGKDPWRLFTIDMDLNLLYGYQKELHRHLSKLELSKDNNYIMRWEKGWPLHEFIDWYSSLPFGDWKGGS